MGYFDGLTNGNFKKDKDGNTVFFPWGALGRGRILPDRSTEATVRGFVRRYLQVTLPIIIGVGIIFGWAWPFLLLPVFSAWYYFGTKSLVSGCPRSEDKLTLKESYTSAAANHNKVTLWLLFICSVLFVLGGIFMSTMAKSSGQMILGLLTAAFFGACGGALGFMLKVKRHAQR
jgi:hypothetical protein